MGAFLEVLNISAGHDTPLGPFLRACRQIDFQGKRMNAGTATKWMVVPEFVRCSTRSGRGLGEPSRLRLVQNRSVHDLPSNSEELGRRARRLNADRSEHVDSTVALAADADRHAVRTRALFPTAAGLAAGEDV